VKRETDIKTQSKKALSKWIRAVHSCTVCFAVGHKQAERQTVAVV